MKKRIIGIFGLMTGLSLIIGGGILLKAENTDDYGQAVAMANNTEDAGMILIDGNDSFRRGRAAPSDCCSGRRR